MLMNMLRNILQSVYEW